MKSNYRGLILQAIASSLHANLASFRFFPVVPFLPSSNCELFSLFDTIPNAGLIFNAASEASPFSTVYRQILQSQKSSFIITNAIKSYENQNYWVACGSSTEPVYAPVYNDIASALANASSFNFNFDSSKAPAFVPPLYPTYPNFVISQSLLDFNETASNERFTLSVHFDKIVTMPVSAGGWFSNAAFVSAYKNPDAWVSGPGTVTWSSLFGPEGTLQFINNGVLVASGAKVVIQSFGQYDSSMLDALESNAATAVWPLYLNGQATAPTFSLGTDGSITITIETGPTDILLLAMQAVSVESLMG